MLLPQTFVRYGAYCFVCSLLLVNGQLSSRAVFSSPNINGSPKVITPEFSEFVE